VFSTILFYVQASNPSEVTRTLQMASAADSNSNFKMVVDMGFDIGSGADWATVQSFISQLSSHPSVGWVGIEGEHTTYTGCEFSGSCQSIGQAWNRGALSESQLENYFSQFNSMAANAGLKVVHYYVTFGSSAWINTQQSIWVTQWPACHYALGDSPCVPLTDQIQELTGGASSNFLGISSGLSTNAFDAWNPTVSSSAPWDNVISNYIQYAEMQPASVRGLVFFETGAFGFVGDNWRSIFTTDLADAMAQYSDWVYPRGGPTTTTTTSSTSATTAFTASTSSTMTSSSAPVTTTTSSAVWTNPTFYTLSAHVSCPSEIQSCGSASPAGVGTYSSGTAVTLTAYPNGGFKLSYWNICTATCQAYAYNPLSWTLAGDTKATAFFVLDGNNPSCPTLPWLQIQHLVRLHGHTSDLPTQPAVLNHCGDHHGGNPDCPSLRWVQIQHLVLLHGLASDHPAILDPCRKH
jgi:hypothetical protein